MCAKLIAVRVRNGSMSVFFPLNSRLVGRSYTTRVVGRLGLRLGPRVVRRLVKSILVSASFQIFASTAAECPRHEGNVRAGECPGNMSEGGMSHTRLPVYGGG